MTRLAIGEGQEYVPLVRRSHELWREIEVQAGIQLLVQCGGLILGDAASPFLRDTREAAHAFGIAHEDLTSAQVRSRFPMFAICQPDRGVLRARGRICPAGGRRASAAGASARSRRRVASRRARGGLDGRRRRRDRHDHCRTLRGSGARPVCRRMDPPAICAGSEIFSIYRQNQVWFRSASASRSCARCRRSFGNSGLQRTLSPIFVGFYGFPAVDGPAGGVKVAAESYEQTTSRGFRAVARNSR